MRTIVTLVICSALSTAAAEDDRSSRGMGGRLGVVAGGGLTPGGFAVAGNYLYRLSDVDWFDQRVDFSFGGQSPACFRDRSDEIICDHGLFDGFAAGLEFTVRRYIAAVDRFAPYIRGGIATRGLFFGDDGVRGLGLPLVFSAGMRGEVAERVFLTGEAALETGFAVFGSGLGLEPYAGFNVYVGAEFEL